MVESDVNLGLANSIIKGVSSIFEKYEKVIVLEDDLLTTQNFLLYMNQALDEYEETKNVFSISGYSLNLMSASYPSETTYFLNRSWSWGWATWKDCWKHFNDDAVALWNEINTKDVVSKLDKFGSNQNWL